MRLRHIMKHQRIHRYLEYRIGIITDMIKNYFEEDIIRINNELNIPWEELKGKHILVTGATGLIGYGIVSTLLYCSEQRNLNITVYALARSLEKYQRRYEKHIKRFERLYCIESDIKDYTFFEEDIDFIIHAASETSSENFIKKAVETLDTAFLGTKNIMELSRIKKCKSVVYLSSMEVYGYPEKGQKVRESNECTFNPLIARNSYPLSKVICENLCYSYYNEYQVPTKIIRLTQTFGPGIEPTDRRVFAEFSKCAHEHKDIVLHTKGDTSRSYLYTADAITAILTILLTGEAGKAYNVANETTYCSILEMANLVAQIGKCDVKIQLTDTDKLGYANTLYMDLDTSRIRDLGWLPKYDLKSMYIRTIGGLSQNATFD